MEVSEIRTKKRKSPLEIYEEFKKDLKRRAEEPSVTSLPSLNASESLSIRLIACEKLLEQFQQCMNKMLVEMSAISAATASFISIVDTCKYWWESNQGNHEVY